MNVFVAPLKVMNYSLVSEFFLDYEKILKELSDSFINVKVIEFCDHCLLVLKILFVLIDQGVALVNYGTNVVKSLDIKLGLQRNKSVTQGLILTLFSLKFVVHGLNLVVIAL